MEELFDIIFVRWLNFCLAIAGIVYAHLVVRKLNSFWIGVPILIWLFQAFFFYFTYLLYYYEIIVISLPAASILFSHWATFSRLLGLLTMFSYLYYIEKTCWRGNGT
jgi:hypothetical protein